MARRTDNIHKRKDGRWEGRMKNGITDSGQIKYKSIYGKSYSEVKEKMSIIARFPENVATARRDLGFSELLSLWLSANSIKHKGSTKNKYLWLIEKHIAPELGNLKITQINSAIVNEFLNRKLLSGRLDGKGGLSAAYVRSITIIIDAALKFAVAEQLCTPLKTPIYKPTQEKKQIKVLNKKEQSALEKRICEDMSLTGLGILISLHTGLRIGEVCALKWEDINLTDNIISVNHTLTRVRTNTLEYKTSFVLDEPKTNKSKRIIPINSFLCPILEIARNEAESPFVVSDKASFVSPRTFEFRFHKLLDGCNINSTNYHTLRHTFATRCIECGCDYKSLSELLGHANVRITLDTYVHSSLELKRSEIEKLTG